MKIKAMLCDNRAQAKRRPNSTNDPSENRYLSPKMKKALSNQEDYMPSEICKAE